MQRFRLVRKNKETDQDTVIQDNLSYEGAMRLLTAKTNTLNFVYWIEPSGHTLNERY